MMPNRIKMVVFDMAGTTVNEQNVVYKTLHKAIVKHKVPVDLDRVLELGAGREKFQAIENVLSYFGLSPQIDAKAVFEDFKVMLDEAYDTLQVVPVDGVEDVMLRLKSKGIIVVLNTGYNSRIANLLLDKINWRKDVQYDALITADDVINGRPSAEMIEMAMAMFGMENASLVLKAGDSAIDIEEGKNAHCGITVGVLSGAQTKEQIASMDPTYILNSLADLLDLDIF